MSEVPRIVLMQGGVKIFAWESFQELRIPMFQRSQVLVFQGHAFWDNFGEHHQIATFGTCTKRSYPAGSGLT